MLLKLSLASVHDLRVVNCYYFFIKHHTDIEAFCMKGAVLAVCRIVRNKASERVRQAMQSEGVKSENQHGDCALTGAQAGALQGGSSMQQTSPPPGYTPQTMPTSPVAASTSGAFNMSSILAYQNSTMTPALATSLPELGNQQVTASKRKANNDLTSGRVGYFRT